MYDIQSQFSTTTTVAVECGMGTCPPESLARKEARSHEKSRAAWQPPEPDVPLLIDKVYPTGSFYGPRVLHGAAKSLTNQHDIDHELYELDGGPSGHLCPGYIIISFL